MSTPIAVAHVDIDVNVKEYNNQLNQVKKQTTSAAKDVSKQFQTSFKKINSSLNQLSKRLQMSIKIAMAPLAATGALSVNRFFKSNTVEGRAAAESWKKTREQLDLALARIGKMVWESKFLGKTIEEWTRSLTKFIDSLNSADVKKFVDAFKVLGTILVGLKLDSFIRSITMAINGLTVAISALAGIGAAKGIGSLINKKSPLLMALKSDIMNSNPALIEIIDKKRRSGIKGNRKTSWIQDIKIPAYTGALAANPTGLGKVAESMKSMASSFVKSPVGKITGIIAIITTVIALFTEFYKQWSSLFDLAIDWKKIISTTGKVISSIMKVITTIIKTIVASFISIGVILGTLPMLLSKNYSLKDIGNQLKEVWSNAFKKPEQGKYSLTKKPYGGNSDIWGGMMDYIKMRKSMAKSMANLMSDKPMIESNYGTKNMSGTEAINYAQDVQSEFLKEQQEYNKKMIDYNKRIAEATEENNQTLMEWITTMSRMTLSGASGGAITIP